CSTLTSPSRSSPARIEQARLQAFGICIWPSKSKLLQKRPACRWASMEEIMSVEIRVPALGESVVEATIASWLKHEGDAVRQGDNLVELETDKVNVEVPAEQDGVLQKIVKQAGEVVAVGNVLGLLD